jgi:iron(III) transport system substrate-binding protein
MPAMAITRALTFIFAAWIALSLPAQAQLIIQGETISDAKTFEAARKEGRLLLYGTYPADAMNPILCAFEADTGIKTEFTRLSTQNMFVRATAEFAAKRLEADYIDLTDLTLVQRLVDLGILNVPHKVPAFGAIPADIKDPDGRWYGLIRIVSVIAVNTARAGNRNLPNTWKDLLNPRWKGLIGTPSNEQGVVPSHCMRSFGKRSIRTFGLSSQHKSLNRTELAVCLHRQSAHFAR